MKVMKRLKMQGVASKEGTPYVFFRSTLEQEIPAFKEFNDKWGARKGRSVSIIGIDADPVTLEEGNGTFMFSVENFLTLVWSESLELLAA